MSDAVQTQTAGKSADGETKWLIEARDVHKCYRLGKRSIEILTGVSLAVEAGEFVALRGASGAGKSTLLHLLGGLDLPTRGEICFDGLELSRLRKRELARFRRLEVGFVFQAYHLLPELDAVENVSIPARLNRVNARRANQGARELLGRVGLSDRLDHRPAELSGGEQQRVAIARALINEPRLLLADEPTGNLDSHTGREIIELLTELRSERGVTLVMATHDAAIAAEAPRVVELLDGNLRGS